MAEREAEKARQAAERKAEEEREQARILKEQEELHKRYAKEQEEARKKEEQAQLENQRKAAERVAEQERRERALKEAQEAAKAAKTRRTKDGQTPVPQGNRKRGDYLLQDANGAPCAESTHPPPSAHIRSDSPPIPTLRKKSIVPNEASAPAPPTDTHRQQPVFRSSSPPIPTLHKGPAGADVQEQQPVFRSTSPPIPALRKPIQGSESVDPRTGIPVLMNGVTVHAGQGQTGIEQVSTDVPVSTDFPRTLTSTCL